MSDGAVRRPLTSRGRRTRQRLVDAARVVFERDGFLNSRLVDITGEAGTAIGSFYTYFDSKEAVLEAVFDDVRDEMVHARPARPAADQGPIGTIEAANRLYLETYRRDARLMALLEQVSTTSDQLLQLKRSRVAAFRERNGRAIADLQANGLVDPDLDPYLAAEALSHMVSRMAYETFVLESGWDFEILVAGVTRLWTNALQLTSRVES